MLRFIRASPYGRGAPVAACVASWLALGCGAPESAVDTTPPAGNADIKIQVSVCPLIGSLSAQPLRTRVGDDIALTAASNDMTDPTTLSFAWYASSGTFLDASSASTTFVCAEAGSQNIYLVVNNGTCGDLADVPITCDDKEPE